MRIRLFSLCCLLGWLAVLSGPAQAAVTPTQLGRTLQLGTVQWQAGHTDAGFEAARRAGWDWQTLAKPNLHRQPDGVWLRFSLDNPGPAGTWFLSLKWPVLDEVRVRLFYPDQSEWGPLMRAGDHVPMEARPLKSQNLVFPIELARGDRTVVYMQVHAHELMALPLVLLDEAQFARTKLTDVAMISLFFGGMLVILLYNSSLFMFTRDSSYLLYVLYLLSAIFYVLTLTGFGQLFLWPTAPPFAHRFYALSASLCFFAPLLFATRFLDVRRHGGWVWRVTWILTAYWALVILVTLFAAELTDYLAIEPMALLHCVLTMAAVISLWRRGSNSARLFTIAWSTLLLATIVHLLALEGLVPLNSWTLHGQLIGMFAEFVLLSMALAQRINLERERRIQAQHAALQASQALAQERESRLQAQQQALAAQVRANEVLEVRVYERTRALEEAKRGLEQVNAQLTRMSHTDALTQLSNRGHFDLMIDEEIRRARRTERPLAVLLLDIDHFKCVNDTFGHPFGDDCLRLVADTLRGFGQRAGDVVARYGGEEFVLALPATSLEEAAALAERIRAAVAALQPMHGDTPLQLSISIGVASFAPPGHCTSAQLLQAADTALYRAKRQGRDRVELAEPAAHCAASGV